VKRVKRFFGWGFLAVVGLISALVVASSPTVQVVSWLVVLAGWFCAGSALVFGGVSVLWTWVRRLDRTVPVRMVSHVLNGWPGAAAAVGLTVPLRAGSDARQVPRIGLAQHPLGMAVRVRLLPGQTMTDVQAAVPRLAPIWGVADVRYEQESAQVAVLVLALWDPLAGTRQAAEGGDESWLD